MTGKSVVKVYPITLTQDGFSVPINCSSYALSLITNNGGALVVIEHDTTQPLVEDIDLCFYSYIDGAEADVDNLQYIGTCIVHGIIYHVFTDYDAMDAAEADSYAEDYEAWYTNTLFPQDDDVPEYTDETNVD